MRKIPVLGLSRVPTTIWLFLVLAALSSGACAAQTMDPLDWKGKLSFHAKTTYDPLAIAGFAAYAGILQAMDSPIAEHDPMTGQAWRIRTLPMLEAGVGRAGWRRSGPAC